jgi:excisionase family DNA binding protein
MPMPPVLIDPQSFSPHEWARLQAHRDVFAAASEAKTSVSLTVRQRGNDNKEAGLPEPVAQTLSSLLLALADGHAVHVTRVDEEVTTSEAAELLNVSRPYLVRLLDERVIPHRKVGTHRRVRRSDVVAYRDQQYREVEASLQALANQAQKQGLGYE